ncbi:DUF5994 family protein [Streptosporangium amethystogenes subsp. fukuiense]|uniref:DUF5994 family protein n=1 Tax=Streptosporangium amethystogenes subsp. fukuiense TaxID=698418 RepID=A0ABW2TFG9_9ACTN
MTFRSTSPKAIGDFGPSRTETGRAIMTPELLSHSTPLTDTTPEARLSLDPALGRRGAVDGAWWPYSQDAAVELPDLIAAVDRRLDRPVRRVGLPLGSWDDIPHRVVAPGRQVKVGWFRNMDPHVVTLICEAMEPVNLLVIPPGTESDTAAHALILATRCAGATRPADILTAAASSDAGSIARDDSQAVWEGEGGQIAGCAPAVGHQGSAPLREETS